MKFHKLYIAAVGAASMAMAGCELDIVNSDQLNTTNMWVDESDVTGATTGIYFELRNAFRQNYRNQFFWGELRVGPAMWDRGTNRSLMDSDMLEVLHSLLNGGTSSVSWTNLYTCINQCNSVIKYAPSVEMSDETRSYCLGNAYFVRAYVYYWIARVWGDAPVILTPTESTGREIYPSRSPRAEVYAQVAQDIESALTHITSNAQGCYYATVDNVNMLKADFALWMYAAQKGGDSYLMMAGEALDAVTRTPLLGKFADVFDVKNKANKEIAVASTKSFIGQVVSLTLLALLLAQVKYRLTTKQTRMMFRELSDTAEQIQWILDTQTEAVHEAALLCKDAQSALFVGRGMGAAISYEGALKLKEVSYLHAEAYAAGEMKHGPIALIDPGFPVIAVATKSATYDKTVSNLMECKARGAKVIVVATEGDEEINKIADCIIRVPAVRDVFSPITASVPLQLLAREVAILRGCDVDQPRNLAKSVTVE